MKSRRWWWTAALALMLCAAGAAAGCARAVAPRSGVGGITHTVQPGETLDKIARKYRTSSRRLMEANGLRDTRELHMGQRLFIPGAKVAGTADSIWPEGRWTGPVPRFDWPVAKGVISSGFGMRNGVMHYGVDIAAAYGTPVHAAADGRVIFTGRIRGYGNVVILEHPGHYVTVYGHNAANQVGEGQRVARGQTIGRVGSSGHATGPNLHFEVRHENVASNPLRYLPALDSTNGIRLAGGG